MGTTLTGTTPQDTYDSLIKVTDNGPISGTLKALSDGLGNDSTLSLSTTAASIAGTLAVTGDFSVADKIVHTGDTNTAIRFPAADTITFETAGVEVARINSDGNVGIGATNLGGKFQVNVATDANIAFNQTGGVARISCFDDAIAASLPLIISGENIRFTPAGTERARFTADGLTFNGDTLQVNALNDYEEGTFNFGISFGGGSTGITYNHRSGTYTKIGRQVTVNGLIALTNKGSDTGDARITGLPFTIPNSVGNYAAPSLMYFNISFANQFQAYGVINTTALALYESTEAGAATSLTDADFANNSEIILSFTYFV
jgi:hypothetical protein